MNTFTISLIIWASDKLTRLGRCQDLTNEYIGCYEDGPTDQTRIFREYGKYLPQWNPTECRKECLSHNLFYYGISQKCMCFCGNSSSDYTQHGERTERECENRCTASPRRIKVFEVKCPRLELKNGDVRISHTTARFICNSGFALFGQEEINCIYRNNTITWDGQQPSCVGVTSVDYTIAPSTSVTSTEVPVTLGKRLTQSTSIKPSSIASEETAVETTKKSETTHQSTSVLSISLTSTEGSTEHYFNQTIFSTSVLSLSSNVTAEITLAQTVNFVSSGKEEKTKNVLQPFLHLLIAILPVIIIFFFILLSCCCTFDDKRYRKRKSLGDTTCGPSSFEFMTPRVIKRQFSASTLPMTYNRSFGMYNSKPELDCDNEIDADDGMETEYETDNIYFDLTGDSYDNQCEEDGIIYV